MTEDGNGGNGNGDGGNGNGGNGNGDDGENGESDQRGGAEVKETRSNSSFRVQRLLLSIAYSAPH
jgi:hypothetical protein